MQASEPHSTAILLATFGALVAASTLLSRAAQRVGIPVALIVLGVGMLAGSEGLGGIPFEDYHFAFRLGTVALVLILFDGGLNTPRSAVVLSLKPAAILATLGVLGTAMLVGVIAHGAGMPWPEAVLLGAVVSSTDAAAVFSALRGSGNRLKKRVGTTLELESGINDPTAVILTTIFTGTLLDPSEFSLARLARRIPLEIVTEFAIGLALGLGAGYAGRWVLARARLSIAGLYPALTLALATLAFSVPTLLHGSGFLAVYVAALVLGDGPLPYRTALLRVHDALAWLAQIVMFLVLGLLVFPSRLWEVAPLGLGIGVFLAVVARPAVAALCLLPFGFTPRETLYVGWVGLRGAVPIILATAPVLSGAAGAQRVFDVVFFVVVVNSLVPGGTVRWATRVLRAGTVEPPAPPAVLEISSMQPLAGELMSFYIEPALAVAGVTIADLDFPEGSAVTLLVRGRELMAPRGTTVLQEDDHVYVFCRPEDRPVIQLMFGRAEGDDH
ncbi:MAG: potassium/proton antiporter [Gemmatimonadaceae bacterium]